MAKQKNKLSKDEMRGLPVFYTDRANYTEIAYMLRDLLISNLSTTPISATDADLEIEDLARYLEEGFVSEALQEFLVNDFGKGMVLGSYMEYKMNLAKQEEQEALEELEGEA